MIYNIKILSMHELYIKNGNNKLAKVKRRQGVTYRCK